MGPWSRKDEHALWDLRWGARTLDPRGVEFRVWAPQVQNLALMILAEPRVTLPMSPGPDGEFSLVVPDLLPDVDYFYLLPGGRLRPDPVSRSQPHGVHGPSRVVNPATFQWHDQSWRGIPLEKYVLYELHTGTFTPEGTFEAIIPRLDRLRDLGITAVELMPVGEFPGSRNWGYDGVFPYAPHSSYGGPSGLKNLIDACHGKGLAVVLDVVYNHLGPEGNYLWEFGPYFTHACKTPWGAAVNFDGPGNQGVRRYFIENALYWLAEFHVDALRFDAIHGIFDGSPRHILEELSETFHREVGQLGRLAWLIAESNRNDPRAIQPRSVGGYGLDALWCDDYHHSIIAHLTGNRSGYLGEFGSLGEIADTIKRGIIYEGPYSKGHHRSRANSAKQVSGSALVAYIQNHDQIANTCQGKRLARLATFEQYKLYAAVLFCSPFLPMLFMGQEFGETAPFLYFTSHGDPALADVVREGRRKEFAELWPESDVPDPQSEQTFQKCEISPDVGEGEHCQELFRLHQKLIALRKEHPALANCRKELVSVDFDESSGWLVLERADPSGRRALLVCNLQEEAQEIPLGLGGGTGWKLALWTGAVEFGGSPKGTEPPSELPAVAETSPGLRCDGRSAVIYFGT